jgi:peptide/nickel transport system substrate-binding protein
VVNQFRALVGLIVVVALAAALFLLVQGLRSAGSPDSDRTSIAGPGGDLVAAIRLDPASFNRYYGRSDNTLELLTHLQHAKLARVDRETGELEPMLAERWTPSADALTWTLTLREGVRFSDGAPFTSADVLFAFEAVYDERTRSALKQTLEVPGAGALQVSAPDERTVVIQFPAPFGPGLRILDNLPILPRHKLETAAREGTMADAWTIATPPAEIAGLGPFRLVSYLPAERIVLERNPHYWRTDDGGGRLPYLDRITLAIVRDQNIEALRLEQGQIDLAFREIRPEDYPRLRQLEQEGRVRLADAGVGLDPNMLWFNLAPHAYAGDPRKAWLQSEEFRKAISHAVNRQALVDSVYLGAGVPIYGPVTPGNRAWYIDDLPRYEYDLGTARALLAGMGLADPNRDGVLEDEAGRPIRFSIITQQGNTIRTRSASVIQEHLRRVGVVVDIVALDAGALTQRFAAGQYDAIFFGVEASSYDPANNLDFWLSSGGFHLWNPGQASPATDWEREIDDLMRQQIATIDVEERQRLFAQVQRLFAVHQPILYFAAPRLHVAMSPKVANARPVPLNPPVLWSADTLAVR